jgi:RHS repeat-associated protein
VQIGLGIDERFTRTKSGVTSTYLADLLGSTVALADSTGAVATSYGYDPYGVTSQTGAANDNQYQFTGRQNDGFGLYYYRARYYNPGWGRFVSEDPIGTAGGINLYGYAGGAPSRYRDPSGLYYFIPGPGVLGCFSAGDLALIGAAGLALAVPGGILLDGMLLDIGAGLSLDAGALELGTTGTVWDSIAATQGVYEGTVIPQSFTLATEGADVWVAPNATEHLAEYALGNLGRSVSGDLVRIGTQAQLSSLQAAVGAATSNGVTYGQLITEGGWELVFSPARSPGLLPALIHALPY